MAVTSSTVKIYPYPLTNLSVTDGTTTVTVGNGITDNGSYYNLECGTVGGVLPCITLTFSADNWVSFTHNCYTDTVHTVTFNKPSHLYAWDYEGTIIYTDSPTPSNGAYYYNNNGKQYEQYELVVGMYALYYCINSYNSANDTINISGDPA